MDEKIEYLIARTKKAVSVLNESSVYVKKWRAESYVKELDLIREDVSFIAS